MTYFQTHGLVVPNGSTFPEVFSHVHNEGKRQVDYYRWAEGYKRRIDEKKANTGGRYAEFFPHARTHAKGIAFEELLNVVRNAIHTNFIIKLSTT